VDLDVSVSNPFLLADQEQSIFLKVGLTGNDLGEGRRTPANVSIVLDRSGSMNGEKMERAKEAAQKVSFVNQVSHELKTPLTNIR